MVFGIYEDLIRNFKFRLMVQLLSFRKVFIGKLRLKLYILSHSSVLSKYDIYRQNSWGFQPVRCTQIPSPDLQWLLYSLNTQHTDCSFFYKHGVGILIHNNLNFPSKMEEKKERSLAKNAAFQLTAGGSAGT